MKKKIAILGSTGAIGKNLFNILKKDKSNFEITLISINKNTKELLKQLKIFDIKNIIITNKEKFILIKSLLRKKKKKFIINFNLLKKYYIKKKIKI